MLPDSPYLVVEQDGQFILFLSRSNWLLQQIFFFLYSQKMNYGFGSNTQISRFGCSFGAACFGDFNVWASCDSWFPTIRAQSSGMFQCHAQENFKNSRSNHNFQQITSRISRLISRFQEYPESLQDLRETSKFDARISRTRYQYFPR